MPQLFYRTAFSVKKLKARETTDFLKKLQFFGGIFVYRTHHQNRIHVRGSKNVVNPAWVGWVFWVDHVGHRGLIWTGVATEVEAGRLQLLQLWPMQ